MAKEKVLRATGAKETMIPPIDLQTLIEYPIEDLETELQLARARTSTKGREFELTKAHRDFVERLKWIKERP